VASSPLDCEFTVEKYHLAHKRCRFLRNRIKGNSRRLQRLGHANGGREQVRRIVAAGNVP